MPRKPGSRSSQWTEPLVLIDGDVPDEPAAQPAQRGGRWRRRYVDIGLLAILVATAVFLTHDPGQGSGPPEAVSTTTRPTDESGPARDPYPLLIAPAAVQPGEVVSMVAYRRRGLCGNIELRLDGVRLDHHVTATIEAAYRGWDTVLLAVPIPPTSRPEKYELELLGSVPGAGRGGPRCGDREQRQGRIASASIVVSGSPRQ